MSVVEDVRKAMQDFLAPELRELSERVAALERRMDDGFKSMDAQFKALDSHIDSRFTALQQMLLLSERVARLEERESHKGKEQ